MLKLKLALSMVFELFMRLVCTFHISTHAIFSYVVDKIFFASAENIHINEFFLAVVAGEHLAVGVLPEGPVTPVGKIGGQNNVADPYVLSFIGACDV